MVSCNVPDRRSSTTLNSSEHLESGNRQNAAARYGLSDAVYTSVGAPVLTANENMPRSGILCLCPTLIGQRKGQTVRIAALSSYLQNHKQLALRVFHDAEVDGYTQLADFHC